MGNIESIQKYIDDNQPLNLKNKFGVNLIHVFATLDSSKLKKFDEYFLKNPELLLVKINTPDKKCKNVYYCKGITVFHILKR